MKKSDDLLMENSQEASASDVSTVVEPSEGQPPVPPPSLSASTDDAKITNTESTDSLADISNYDELLPRHLQQYPQHGMCISSVSEISDFLLALPKDAIVFVDDEYTLYKPAANVLNRMNREERRFLDDLISQQDDNEALKAAVKKNDSTEPVEASLVSTIQKMQAIGIRVVMISEKSEDDRRSVVNQLEKLGLSFAESAPTDKNKIKFKGRKYKRLRKKGKDRPVYYKGVLYSDGHNKGRVIEAFLNETEFNPEAVVLLDDKARNLDKFREFAERTDTTVYGFMNHTARANSQLDTKLLAFQYKNLVENHEWLTDEKAKERLDEQSEFSTISFSG